METITAYKLGDGIIFENEEEAKLQDYILKLKKLLESQNIKNYNYDTLLCIAKNRIDVIGILK